MSARYVLTRQAEYDIEDIAAYIATDNPKAADRFVDAAYDAFERLGQHPGMGHLRRDLTDQSVRFWTVMGRYMVVYRESVPVQILRVLSAYRNIASILR